MTARENTSNTAVESSCPKRPWVMMMFSDDEAVDRELVPPGLRFHLSRCPACSALADRLTAVTKSLADLADETPAGDLIDSAQGRVRAMLEHGPVLTGRVEIPDEPEPAEPSAGRLRMRLSWVVGSAMAASLAVALTGVWMFNRPAERGAINDSWMGEGWHDGYGDVNHYVWQEPVVNVQIEGPPLPAEADFVEESKDGVQDHPLIYHVEAPALTGGADPPGAPTKPSALQRALDKPQHAVSTKDTAKDR